MIFHLYYQLDNNRIIQEYDNHFFFTKFILNMISVEKIYKNMSIRFKSEMRFDDFFFSKKLFMNSLFRRKSHLVHFIY